ncbi:pogo transposable element with KRAB domain [Dugong dugon]
MPVPVLQPQRPGRRRVGKRREKGAARTGRKPRREEGPGAHAGAVPRRRRGLLTSAALLPSPPNTLSSRPDPPSSHHVSFLAPSRGAARTGSQRGGKDGALTAGWSPRRPHPAAPARALAARPGEMESTAYPLTMTLKEEEEEEEIQGRELEDGCSDMQKVRICSEGGWVPALFDEVAIYFSDEEWEVLTEQQKALYREVMRMNYETVLSLEFPFPKPDMITRLEGEEESQKSKEWQLQGGTFTENEDSDVKPPDWAGPVNATSQFPQPSHFDGFGLRLARDLTELPEWSEGYPFYMAMGFPGYDLSADDITGKFQFSRGMRRSYDAGFKLMVVEYAESTNNCQAAKQFGVLEKNVRDWRKVKPQLQNAHAMRRAFRGPKNGRFALVDQRVAEYVRYMQAKGDPITREAMQLKALEIAQEMNIPEKGFKASLGWCRRMMRRYDLSLRHKVPVPQHLPEDLTEKLVTYQRSVLALRRAHEYEVAQMGNADETPICLEVPSRVTVDNQGEKPVLVKTPGREKLKITAMLGVLADGRKLPPYIILRGTYIPPGKFPSGMEIRCHRYGWMTEDLMQDWLEVVWRRRTGAVPKQRGMLILNGFRGHATDSVKSCMENMNTDMVIIPGGLTSQLQVLDVVVYKPLNDSVRAQYSNWLLAGNLALSPTGNAKKPPLGLFLEWVMVAWNSISRESIVQGFKKCHISSNLEDEDDVLWEIESELPGGGDPPKECDAESMTESK